jgi:hypothetical protein
MRKISKALPYPPAGDRLNARPRGISGATITSWDGPPPEVDLEALFSKPDNHVSLTGAESQPVRTASRPAADTPEDEPVTFTTPDRFVTVAII